jgi:WD40 repeat protein
MLRWLGICLLLAVGTVALMVFFTQYVPELFGKQDQPKPVAPQDHQPGRDVAANPPEPAPRPAAAPAGEYKPAQERPTQVVLLQKPTQAPGGAFLVVNSCSILTTDKQEVPADRDGRLIFLATEVAPGELDQVPPLKRLPYELGFIAVDITDDPEEVARTPEGERVTFADNPRKYRRWKDGDKIEPGKVVLARQPRVFRRLEAGDKVKEGQLLALVNPALALDELSVKIANLDAAEADRLAAKATKEESLKRVHTIEKARLGARGSVPDDEYRGAVLTYERYKQEEVAKTAAVWKAQREVNAAHTTLKLHEIRAVIPGTVKTLYKNRGDAIKNLEAVMQLQNPNLLQVEGKVEAQDAKALRTMLKEAKDAHKSIEVQVDASQMEAPKAVLQGHLADVTAVAVSNGSPPVIVSGSEDHTVRIWGRPADQDRWSQQARLEMGSTPRSLACSPKGAKTNLLVVGDVNGSVRLFNLANLQGPERVLSVRHNGAVNYIAFSPDGARFATAGDDRAIHVWGADGSHKRTIPGAHAEPVTSVQFASPTRLVSAGRDGRLVVWDIRPGQASTRVREFERRPGDVGVLGVNPHDQTVLIDQQPEEMRILSLDDKHIVSTLQNPPNSGNFATLALFGPDGKTVLTNSGGAFRLQLWRAESQPGRGAEVRQFVWNSAPVTCGAFAPDGSFAVTGTADHRVLVWAMPDAKEVEQTLKARLTYVEEFLDNTVNKVQVRAELANPNWIIPGPATRATLVIPFAQK